MAQRLVVETPDPENEHREPALVFGQRGKLRPDGPFLSLLAEFESELTTADQLLVIGYSFRDEHVNEVIRRWTLEDSSRTIQIVDPSFSPEFRSFGWELLHSLNPEFPTPPPPPRVSVQERRASEAFADLSAVMP